MSRKVSDKRTKGFLAPLAVAYGSVVTLRNALYDSGCLSSYKSTLPVISVGNLTAGGNGKTPLVISIAQQLAQRGHSPVVVSRGYGGSEKGPHRVESGDDAARVGDEPLLIARRANVPVVIARRRADGARFVEKKGLGDVIVLDDGFQHRALQRDCNIVCIRVDDQDAITEFLAGVMLPLGRFREPKASGLERADTVMLVNRSSNASATHGIEEDIAKYLPRHATIFRSEVALDGVWSLNGQRSLAPSSVIALSAIANPRAYHDSLERSGFRIVEALTFPDHHAFTREEISAIRQRSPAEAVVCTEKDSVKIRELGEFDNVFELRIKAVIKPEDAFCVHLERVIERVRSGARDA